MTHNLAVVDYMADRFRDESEEDVLSPLDLGGGHLVLARRSANVSELRH